MSKGGDNSQSGLFGGPHASDGSMQSFYNFLDPGDIFGRSSSSSIGANFFDPGNMLGLNPAADPTRGKDPPGGPSKLPPAAGPVHPMFYDPHSFIQRPVAPGKFNAMVAQLAGPLYDPTLLPRPKAPANGPGMPPPIPGSLPNPTVQPYARRGGADKARK